MRTFAGHSIWWDVELGIARGKAVGEIDEPSANFILSENIRIARQYGEEIIGLLISPRWIW